MKRIGITGQNGFIGWHLYQTLKLSPDQYNLIDFCRSFFDEPNALDEFVQRCDVIVHLAGLNRHADQKQIYQTNTTLTLKLIGAFERTGATPHVLVSSSTQEERDNAYGNSKRISRTELAEWAAKKQIPFTGFLLPNVFGPFGKPFYNSVVATFCYQLCNGEEPRIDTDAELSLIYVDDVVKEIRNAIDRETNKADFMLPAPNKITVSAILAKLRQFKEQYVNHGILPHITTRFELQLFNTLRSYMDHEATYPRYFKVNTDERGVFVELAKLGTGGQVSFSTTKPGITRGNHFHTRKVERFAVIKGKAEIQLRKIGTNEVLNFKLDDQTPCYVDMPVWYTHNITNTGEDELYTIFWINEWYDPQDPDTYFEKV